MNNPAKRDAQYEDLFDLPEHMVGEIIHGQLYSSPRPAPKHALAYSSLGFAIGGPFHHGSGGPGGWWILDEPELHLDGHILVPDIAGWRRERMPSLPEEAFFSLAPDWLCEILSPATSQRDRSQKMPLYAAQGVKHLWLVDPELRTLEVYQLNADGQWVLLATLKDDDAVQLPPFDAISFGLDSLWA